MTHRQRWSARPPSPDPWEEIPLVAQFHEQTLETYAVRDLHNGAMVAVPKARAVVEAFPPTPQQPLRGVRVTRWSGYALALALLGGIGGISIGIIVSLAALLGLARFRGRARTWRQSHPGVLLPLGARGESDRLRTALGQGCLAILLGTLILAGFLFIAH